MGKLYELMFPPDEDLDPDTLAVREWQGSHKGYKYDGPGRFALYPTYTNEDVDAEVSCLTCGYTGKPQQKMYNLLCGRCSVVIAWPVYSRVVLSVVGTDDGKYEVIRPL